MTTKSETVSRRGFLAAVGVGAAATAIPAGALAALPSGGGAPLDAFRAWYRRELEQLAEQVRPGFETGEFRDNREDTDFRIDEAAGFEGPGWNDPDSLPFARLQELVKARFGLTTAGSRRAYALLAVAANTERADSDAADFGASEAVALDLLALARSRGWYTPTADEEHQELEVLA